MKRLACILLSFCTASTACNEIDPAEPDLGEKRLVRARLSGAPWQRCCRKAEIVEHCPDPVNTREKALKLLVVAGGRCLDKAVRAVENHAREDLAAAYLIRAERNDDPVDLLRALETARGFNRALALQKLELHAEAIGAWDPVTKEESTWGREAGAFRKHLSDLPEPKWELQEALQEGDRAAVMRIVRAYPFDAAEFFERAAMTGDPNASVLAEALTDTGDPYARAVMDAVTRPGGPEAVERALSASQASDYGRAASILERAGNPLYLVARVYAASSGLMASEGSLPLWNALAARVGPEYRNLSYRIELGRANALEHQSQYLQAHTAYARAAGLADGDPTRLGAIHSRRSQNYSTIGSAAEALREALRALRLLHRVAHPNTRHQTYGAAAMTVQQLGYPDVALLYQQHAVDTAKTFTDPKVQATHFAAALRGKADLLVAAGRDAEVHYVVAEASRAAQGVPHAEVRSHLQMRLKVVTGLALVKKNPPASVAAFTEAMKLATEEHSSYRAVLHFNRAAAHRSANNLQAADEDTTTALAILRNEAQGLIDSSGRGEFEAFWNAYFGRFQEYQQEFIQERIDEGDYEAAFLIAEQTRAFEPLQLVLRSRLAPPGYRPIETKEDLQHHLAHLPEDTAILQYLVLPRRTYTWVLVRGKITPFTQRADRGAIERWADDVAEAAHSRLRDPFEGAMRAVHDGLFRAPLAAARSKTRLVIVPDGPMHGLPFPAVGNRTDGLLIERGSIATAASTSLYLYSLARDRQFPSDGKPSVFIVGDPAIDEERSGLERLRYAREEAEELKRDRYPDARLLTGAEATIDGFLALGRDATIIHFAGHGIPNPQQPWKSRLLLAPGKDDSGELSAERLMQELSELERTRLVVLGACSTAAGDPVGPQGLAPLVRPLIAANVPGVVGTLWDVGDATAKQLLGSLHCHYRRGDDVAVALRKAQLERLRDNPLTWAPFQVVGHAGSPYARPAPSEETRSDRVCTENSLHRPDGLHPQ